MIRSNKILLSPEGSGGGSEGSQQGGKSPQGGTPQQGGGPKSGKGQGAQTPQSTPAGKIPWGPLEDQLPKAENITAFDGIATIHSRHIQPIEADDPKTKAKASKTFTVHIEGNELIRLFGTYGPVYSVEISEDNLFALLQDRHVVTDPATRKRYIIHEGKPKLED